jgi:hypothetical protein
VLMQRFRFRTQSGGVPGYRYEPSGCDRVPEDIVFERTAAAAGIGAGAAVAKTVRS